MPAELGRVLKPGGWICARTPNRWGYIGIGAKSIPNQYHVRLLGLLQPGRKSEDVFPTMYCLNTPRQLRQHFPPHLFSNYTYAFNSEPAYFGDSLLANRVAKFVFSATPETFSALWYIFLMKRPAL